MHKTELIVAVLVASVLAGMFLRYGVSESFMVGLIPGMPQIPGVPPLFGGSVEGFMQRPIGAPTAGESNGPYDGIVLNATHEWAKTEPYDLSRSTPGQPQFLVNNRVGPDCCPSAFTSDTGCVCLSDADKQFMGSRGGNRA
jgi:hypothetical protein